MVERIRTLGEPAGRRQGRPGLQSGHGPAAPATSAGSPPPRPRRAHRRPCAGAGSRPVRPCPARGRPGRPPRTRPPPRPMPRLRPCRVPRSRRPRPRDRRGVHPERPGAPRRPNGWSPARPRPACRARRRRVPRPRERHRRLPGGRVRLHRRPRGGPAAASPGQEQPARAVAVAAVRSRHTRGMGIAGSSPRPGSPGNAPARARAPTKGRDNPRCARRPGIPTSEAERLHAPGRSPCDEPTG